MSRNYAAHSLVKPQHHHTVHEVKLDATTVPATQDTVSAHTQALQAHRTEQCMSTQPITASDIPTVAATEMFSGELLRAEALMALAPVEPDKNATPGVAPV